MLTLSSQDEQVLLFSEVENPFQGPTEIRFYLPRQADVELWVMNSRGEKVINILNARLDRGNHTVPFESASLSGSVFFYFLRTSQESFLKAVS